MKFTVIDRRTKERADPHAVIAEFFLPELTESHGDFVVDADGELFVMDCCGRHSHLDSKIFTAEWVDES